MLSDAGVVVVALPQQHVLQVHLVSLLASCQPCPLAASSNKSAGGMRWHEGC
jgi:hypothetical protein